MQAEKDFCARSHQGVSSRRQAILDAESADAKIAQLEYDHTMALNKKGVTSNEELAIREATLAKATAKVKVAAAELDYTMAKAPFDGIVGPWPAVGRVRRPQIRSAR